MGRIFLTTLFSLFLLTSCFHFGSGRCPQGFVEVPPNRSLKTKFFCVMRFEAKRNGAGDPISQGEESPWVNINAFEAQNACESIRQKGYKGKFSLISNREWMAIARNIERVAYNWTGLEVGQGHIPRGHSDGSPNHALPLHNFPDSPDPYEGTFNRHEDLPGEGQEQRRAHVLSNGSVIWDFAGNVWEWVDWKTTHTGFSTGPIDTDNTWHNFPRLSGSLKANDVLPQGPYNHQHSLGRWWGGPGGAALRGGSYGDGDYGGIFSLLQGLFPTFTDSDVGFRCVYRPRRLFSRRSH